MLRNPMDVVPGHGPWVPRLLSCKSARRGLGVDKMAQTHLFLSASSLEASVASHNKQVCWELRYGYHNPVGTTFNVETQVHGRAEDPRPVSKDGYPPAFVIKQLQQLGGHGIPDAETKTTTIPDGHVPAIEVAMILILDFSFGFVFQIGKHSVANLAEKRRVWSYSVAQYLSRQGSSRMALTSVLTAFAIHTFARFGHSVYLLEFSALSLPPIP